MCRLTSRKPQWVAVWFLVIGLPGIVAGCGLIPTPPPEAVLEGTWAMTVEEAPDLEELLLTFDEDGNLIEVTYRIDDNAALVVPYPVSSTDVNDSSVTISATFNNNGLVFNGALNDAGDRITGRLTTLISVGATVISIDNGPAILSKQ